MKKLLGVIAVLVCVSSFAETEFWSMGSFNVLANAVAEKNRISGISGLSVQIATFSVGDVSYRLVIEKDSYPMEQRQKIMNAGITPWSLSMDSQHLSVTKKVSERVPEMSVEPDVATQPSIALETPMRQSPETSVSRPRLNLPNPDESYFEYCINKANVFERTVFCGDESFSRLVLAENKHSAMSEGKTSMSSGSKALAEFCAMRASLWEREEYCID